MSTINDQDEQVLQDAISRVRSGDGSAFASVVRMCQSSLRAWLATHSPPGIDPDEIAQRSFVVAYTQLEEFELGTNFRAWLFAIARFQLKTEVTRLRRTADYHTRYAPDLLRRELERRCEVDAADEPERLTHLRKCVDHLAEHLGRFVTWRYTDEITLEEMAHRSERSISAVKKQLWKIRRKLQECVEQRLSAEGEST